MIRQWNSVVPRGGKIVVLGDLFWHVRSIPAILPRLNGNIILVKGNHDRSKVIRKFPRVILDAPHFETFGEQKIWVSHYCHRVWPEQHHGSVHMYGHSHGNLAPWPWLPSRDVGIDAMPERRPYLISEALNLLPTREKKQPRILAELEALHCNLPSEARASGRRLLEELTRLLGEDHHK